MQGYGGVFSTHTTRVELCHIYILIAYDTVSPPFLCFFASLSLVGNNVIFYTHYFECKLKANANTVNSQSKFSGASVVYFTVCGERIVSG